MDETNVRPLRDRREDPLRRLWESGRDPGYPYRDEWGVDHAEERVRFLVLVDGRLVDSWTEPHHGTPWEEHAERFDRASRPPAPPEPPRWQRALAWLDCLVGGRTALEALDDHPLTLPGPPADLGAAAGTYGLVLTELDRLAGSCFDAETRAAFHRGLAAAWRSRPQSVTAAASPAHTAAGVCWVIGKANGLFDQVRQIDAQRALGITSSLHSQGQRLAAGLRNVWGEPAPWTVQHRDLLDLGRPDLLLSSTRRDLLRARDLALEARAAHAADAAAIGGGSVLPS